MDVDTVLAVIVALAMLLTAVVVAREVWRKPARARPEHHVQRANAHAAGELGEDEVTPVSQPPARPIELDGLTPTGRR